MTQALPKDVPQTLKMWERYPAYKNSVVEWLGEIPKDWRVVTVRNLIRSEYLEIQDGNHGEIHPRAEDYVEMGIPFVMANNIRNGKLNLDECKYISEEQAKSLRIGFSQSGDVLLTHKGTLGETAIIPTNINYHFIMLTPQVTYYRLKKKEIDKVFLYYYFQSKAFQERLKFMAGNQSTRDYVGLVAQKNLEIVLPYPHEQNAIASFLDRETAKIDAMIAKKERLIELLEEKRTAIISHAVTKGLDSTVPMKDSGVEWLGEIPLHWEVKALGYALCYISYGFTNPMPVSDEGAYMLTANDIGDGFIQYETARRTTEQAFIKELTDKSRPRLGDILLTKDGTLGRVAVCDRANVCINQSVAVLRVNKGIVSVDYLQNLLRADVYQNRMCFDAGGTTIKHIYISRVVKMLVAFPPPEEQEAISKVINSERDRINSLIAKIREGIEKLKEYRTALISAAVTGKIDVRNEVAS